MDRWATNIFAATLLAPFPECRNHLREVRRRNTHSKDVDPGNRIQRVRQLVALTRSDMVLHGVDPFSIASSSLRPKPKRPPSRCLSRPPYLPPSNSLTNRPPTPS